ncbi:hypothetical protein [Nostoc sp. 'Peltigera malacea cyanobiont' DB3992]|uniref:hypothetical protein n=1 Tax=Nostoc sp. 'Peltigera malacea cyanobiont' DB3992 TaxID=1206980 RepID=UPI0015D4CFAE|nr:hypothetical protein [Nostoc sp. 'Peltigera malacea cyanobiont' DB3992]
MASSSRWHPFRYQWYSFDRATKLHTRFYDSYLILRTAGLFAIALHILNHIIEYWSIYLVRCLRWAKPTQLRVG